MLNLNSKDLPDFSVLEKEALKEISLDIIKSDLQKSLTQLHQKSMEDIGKRISSIEEQCVKEIRNGLEKYIQSQLDLHFPKVIQAYQGDISKILSPIVKKAEEDVDRLNNAVNKTNEFCQKIEAQYALKWNRPFLTLILSTAFAAALMGLGLFLMQVPAISVFLMNKKTRQAYDIGVRVLDYEKETQPKTGQSQVPENKKNKKKTS